MRGAKVGGMMGWSIASSFLIGPHLRLGNRWLPLSGAHWPGRGAPRKHSGRTVQVQSVGGCLSLSILYSDSLL